MSKLRYTLEDKDGAGGRFDVTISLAEDVEVIVVKADGSERAVARVELIDGRLQAQIWDEENVADGELITAPMIDDVAALDVRRGVHRGSDAPAT
ncbi:MAG TPA: hypothetical protein VJ793_23400 [Anaerolineae bacterium]|nr:hypothetical protein [Anaerolineae bacterium]